MKGSVATIGINVTSVQPYAAEGPFWLIFLALGVINVEIDAILLVRN
jgi:hypothetical protein